MFCTACGTKNTSESNFCKQCGLKLEKPTTVKISEEEFERARPEEEQVSALLERAYHRRAEGDLAGAVTLCEEALRINPDSTSAHSLLGQLYAEQGERDDAVREYERVLQLNPGSIADRVKLDELRDDTEDSELRPGQKRTRIVLTEQKFSSEKARNGLALAGIAAGLMLLGAVLAMQLRPQATASTHTANSAGQAGTAERAATKSRPLEGTISVPDGTGAERQAAASSLSPIQNVNPFGTGFGPLFSNDTATPASPPVRNNPPPTYAANQNATGYGPQTRLPNMTVREASAAPRSSPPRSSNNNNRVRLPQQDDGVTDEGNGRYVIRVNAGGGNESGSNGSGQETASGGSGSTGGGTIRIQPDSGSGPNPSDIGNPALHQARSQIAIGNDLKAKGDFTRAIQAYKSAIPSAGDETGYVYHSIARCYQERGDRQSAVNNYQKAVTELNKLIGAGRNVESARATIRVCENGIRICQSE